MQTTSVSSFSGMWWNVCMIPTFLLSCFMWWSKAAVSWTLHTYIRNGRAGNSKTLCSFVIKPHDPSDTKSEFFQHALVALLLHII